MAKEKIQTPGAALKVLMTDYQVSPNMLAKAISLSPSGVRQIASGQTRITVPVALRLAKYFGPTPDYWINLQTLKDLADAAKDPELTAILKAISKVKKPAAKPAPKTKQPRETKTASKSKSAAKPRAKK
jgi:addiction module HigA family antidote